MKSNQVAVFPSSEVASLLKEGTWKLLDIRPEWEREKASVAGEKASRKEAINASIVFKTKWKSCHGSQHACLIVAKQHCAELQVSA